MYPSRATVGVVTDRPEPEFPGMPESTQPQSDALIVRAVLAGDAEAFRVLVDRHHDRLLRVATHLLGDADDAEDAVQDAFVRAYRHLGGYREQDRFGSWVLRIVVNQCRTRATKAARYVPFDAERLAESEHAAQVTDLSAVDVRTEQQAELAYALAQLGAEQREAIVLRFADELSYEEIAELTGVGVSALKMRVQRAVIRLRALLASPPAR